MIRFPEHKGGYLGRSKRKIMKSFFHNVGENQTQTITQNIYGYDHIPYTGIHLSKDFTQSKKDRMMVTGANPVVTE